MAHRRSDTAQEPLVGYSWDEPPDATTRRGWLFPDGGNSSVGNYLDYGPDYYRVDIGRKAGRASIHAVVYGHGSRWFNSPATAKRWIEQHGARRRA